MRTRRGNRGRNPRRSGVLVDLAHVALCAGIIVCAVFVFLSPSDNRRLFPVVFGLAAVMQFLYGIPRILQYRRSHGRERGQLFTGIAICVLGIILLALTAAGVVTSWS